MKTIPDYLLEDPLVETPLAWIYRARRASDAHPVLLKVLKSEDPAPAEQARLAQEFALLRALDIPRVIKAHELRHAGATSVLVLAAAEGRSVAQWIQHGPLAPGDFLPVAGQMAAVVGRLHAAQIIHKDLQPAHFVWDAAAGEITLLDLSFATRLSQERLALKNPELIEGTLPYLSPEQTGRMNRRLDYRTDFYSLGVTFYEMLTGRLPFTASDPLELVYSHIARKPLWPDWFEGPWAGLAAIVFKLLEKNAEDRYQSALGLQADLEQCARQLAETGRIAPFVLAQRDVSAVFHLPQKLYGREAEVQTLLQAFERTARGGAEVLLVTGYSGIGKTTLVHEVHKPITERRGYFIEGKFDPLQRHSPYYGWIQAFTVLVHYLLMESDEQLAAWKRQLETALGGSGQLLAGVIPDLQLILGPQPEPPALPPTEAQNRFQRVFQDFVKVLAAAAHPLTVFLDDLQWADQASLLLLETLVNDQELGHFLFVGAYRDNEVDAGHPLARLREKAEQAGRRWPALQLRPLEAGHVQALLIEMLHCPPAHVYDLAGLVHAKTDGNPFFVGEFLKMLYEAGYLTYAEGWQWDLARIRQAHISDNVVDLMVRKIELLPAPALQVLKVGASIGVEFDLGLLEQVVRRLGGEPLPALRTAQQAGLIILEEGTGQFVHDKVSEAVYGMTAAEEREGLHYQIGQTLLAAAKGAWPEKLVFSMAEQFNAAQARLTEAEKSIVFHANLEAGRRARAAAAHAAAARFFRKAAALLPDQAWEADYATTLALYGDWAEAEYMATAYPTAEALINQALRQARTLPDKIRLYHLQINYYQTSMRFKEAVVVILQVMAEIGLPFPAPEAIDPAAIQAQQARFARLLSGHPVETLATLPEAASPYKEAIELLAEANPVFWLAYPQAAPYALLESVNLTLEHGVCAASARSMVMLGFSLCAAAGQVELGYGVGEVALKLIERFGDTFNLPNVWMYFYNFIAYWRHPLRYGGDQLLQAHQMAVAAGNNLFAAYSLNNYLGRHLFTGDDLAASGELYRQFAAPFFRLKQPNTFGTFNFLRQVIANLLGQAADPSTLEGEFVSLQTELPKLQALHFSAEIGVLSFAQLYVQCFLGDFAGALQYLALPGVDEGLHALQGLFPYYLGQFFSALACLQNYRAAPAASRAEYLAKAEAVRAQFRACAAQSPGNFEPLHALVAAEVARVKEEPWAAAECYQQAIRTASEQNFTHIEALANELAAKFWQACGMEAYAQAHIRAAHEAYQRWGALAKVAQLQAQYPWLAPASAERTRLLDVNTITKAAQAISGEIELERLVARLMQIVIENAGAERGVLLLKKGARLVVQADTRAGAAPTLVDLEDRPDLPHTLVHFVQRTGQSILLDDTAEAGDYAADPYWLVQRPRSVLCLPLIRQKELTGMLYLENNLATHAFRPHHLALLEILCTQAAIALENARYYAESVEMNASLKQEIVERKQAEEKIRSLNAELEQRVQDRTTQLAAVNKELEAFSYSVSHDLRSPATRIEGYSRMLQENYADKLDTDGQHSLHRIRANCQRMNELIEDLLQLSRLSLSELRRTTVDLSALAVEVAAELQQQQLTRAVEWVIAPQLTAEGDRRLLRIVLENLLDNAWKFTARQASARIEFGWTASVSPGRPAAYFVRDNGAGFDMEQADRLFGAFQRLHSDAEFPGTGIGLATVQRIIRRHGGQVWAEGAVGRGATMYFTLT